jgi:hypothetical protein
VARGKEEEGKKDERNEFTAPWTEHSKREYLDAWIKD